MDITSILNSFEKFYALFNIDAIIGIFDLKAQELVFGGLENSTFKKDIQKNIDQILFLQSLSSNRIKGSENGTVFGDFIVSIKTRNGIQASKLFELLVLNDCLTPLDVLGTTTEHLSIKSMDRLKINGRDIRTSHGHYTQYVYEEDNLLRKHILRSYPARRRSGILINIYNVDPQTIMDNMMRAAPQNCHYFVKAERTGRGILSGVYIITPEEKNYIGVHISNKERT